MWGSCGPCWSAARRRSCSGCRCAASRGCRDALRACAAQSRPCRCSPGGARTALCSWIAAAGRLPSRAHRIPGGSAGSHRAAIGRRYINGSRRHARSCWDVQPCCQQRRSRVWPRQHASKPVSRQPGEPDPGAGTGGWHSGRPSRPHTLPQAAGMCHDAGRSPRHSCRLTDWPAGAWRVADAAGGVGASRRSRRSLGRPTALRAAAVTGGSCTAAAWAGPAGRQGPAGPGAR